MKPFKWVPTLELGVPEIDDDHKALLGLVQGVESAIADSDGAVYLSRLDDMLLAAEQHFLREEAFLERLAYPNLERHRRYHAHLLTQAKAIRQLCEAAVSQSQRDKCATELLGFLIDDIIRGDMEFKSFLQEEGIARYAPLDSPPDSP